MVNATPSTAAEDLMPKLRIAILGISYEALLRSPVPTETMEIQRGQAMLDAKLWMVRGMDERLSAEADVEIVPLLWATALPGGGFTRRIYDEVKGEALAMIAAAGRLDGVLLANHGAMEVHGLDRHADTDFAEAVRDAIGPDVPMAVALDLHGHISPRMLEVVDAVSVLRTAPHRDDRETGYRAADQLMRIVRTGVRPKIAAVRIPILIPGEQAVTTASPARELYGSLAEYDSREGVQDANIMVGFAWNDRPWIGMTAIVTAASDADLAREGAQELARQIWARRRDFVLPMETAEVGEGLQRAAASEVRPVFVSDSGDNTTAGAPGDLTGVLQATIDAPELADVVVAGITAPAIVARCRAAGVGAEVVLDLGSEHVSGPKNVRTVRGTVEALGDAMRPDGFQPYLRQGAAWAVVRIGHVLATFHAAPIGITTPAHFRLMGIHPTDHKVYVVKLGYLHPQIEDISARHILLISDGAANLDVRRLDWRRIPRPAYPVDPDATWSPESNTFATPS
jgi:microcystin degradation protein MlrC